MSNTNSTVALGNTITKAKRSRGWCFTLNNYTEEDFNKLKNTCTQFCKKFIIGKEVGKKELLIYKDMFIFRTEKPSTQSNNCWALHYT